LNRFLVGYVGAVGYGFPALILDGVNDFHRAPLTLNVVDDHGDPSADRDFAIVAPTPRLAPVMRATLPARTPISPPSTGITRIRFQGSAPLSACSTSFGLRQ
jgi:hypothetical protein